MRVLFTDVLCLDYFPAVRLYLIGHTILFDTRLLPSWRDFIINTSSSYSTKQRRLQSLFDGELRSIVFTRGSRLQARLTHTIFYDFLACRLHCRYINTRCFPCTRYINTDFVSGKQLCAGDEERNVRKRGVLENTGYAYRIDDKEFDRTRSAFDREFKRKKPGKLKPTFSQGQWRSEGNGCFRCFNTPPPLGRICAENYNFY